MSQLTDWFSPIIHLISVIDFSFKKHIMHNIDFIVCLNKRKLIEQILQLPYSKEVKSNIFLKMDPIFLNY